MNLRIFLLVMFFSGLGFSQNEKKQTNYTFEASGFNGTILLHNPDISHLITEHPNGLILGYNRKTYGYKEWEEEYNYPDIGGSFIYHNSKNSTLGDNLAVYAHLNFYFFKRNLQFRIAQGLSYATNPYDRVENFRNNAYGTKFLSSNYVMLNYQNENIFEGLGFKAGVTLIHYSNGNVKSPNTSTNTLALNAGLTYTLIKEEQEFVKAEKIEISRSVKYSLAFRTGINGSDIIGSGQFPFYIFSAYADKRIGRKSAFHLGTDVFFSNFLKDLIRYESIAFPEKNVELDTDFKRVGVFIGHELFINKLSITTQLGYYVYYPYDFEGKIYNRIGLKRYFGDKWFGVVSLKSHAAAAEAVEFGIGIRL